MSQSIPSAASLLPDIQYPYPRFAKLADLNQPRIWHRPGVLIRQAQPEDAVAIWNVLKAAITPLIGRAYTQAQIDAWIADEEPQRLARDYAPARTAFVAESERRIIGFARISGAEVEALYVHPARARRKVGKLLLATLENGASGRQVKALYLDAALNAVPFYRSAGYQVMGPSAPAFDNGVLLPCVRMQKTLPPDRGKKPGWGFDFAAAFARISPFLRYRPRLAKRPRLAHWPSRAGCCRA
jgi:GNAT superfamily N-acetyltransferase